MAFAFELLQLCLFGGERLIQATDLAELGAHAGDLLGARAAEVAVGDEEAAGARRVLLIEEKPQRLLAADEVSGAQLAGETLAGACQIGRMAVLVLRKRGTPCHALRVLVLHALQSLAGGADRELRRAQVASEPVALH